MRVPGAGQRQASALASLLASRFLLPRLSFGSVCRAQARAKLCVGTSVPNHASALLYCSRQPRWLAVKVFRVAGPHSLHCLCLHASVQLHQHANALGAVPGTSRSSQPFSRAADTLRVRIMRSCFCRCGKQINQPEGTKWRAPATAPICNPATPAPLMLWMQLWKQRQVRAVQAPRL